MIIDLYGDKFPSTISVAETKVTVMALISNNNTIYSSVVDDLARHLLLIKESVINGLYDSDYLVVTSGNDAQTAQYEAFKLILGGYGIAHYTNDKTVTIPKNNTRIHFTTYHRVMADEYEYMNTKLTLACFSYKTETSKTLTDITPKLKKTLGFSGMLCGFLSQHDIDNINTTDARFGHMRLSNFGVLEVFDGDAWNPVKGN